jgi:hypothetical protein
MTKLSISITDDIYQAVLNTIPKGTPFSQGLTALLRIALGLPENPRFPIIIGSTSSNTEVSPEIQSLIRAMVKDEINAALHDHHIDTLPEENSEPPRQQEIETSEWLTQAEIVKMLPETILLHTRKSKVSKAVASGKLITNGLIKTECRVQKLSANAWITEVTK